MAGAQDLERRSRDHYDAYPYEVGVRESHAYETSTTPVGRFIERVGAGPVLDVGCGPGNLLPALARRAGCVVGLDLSPRSLEIARRTTERGDGRRTQLVRASALALPFRRASQAAVLAVGSLHHTPDPEAGFHEVARVLAPGGSALLALYRRGSYYQRMYFTLGRLARRAERRPIARIAINRILILPLFALYFVAGRVVVHRRLELPAGHELLNYFADQLLNPVVSFHTVEEITRWADATGLDIVETVVTHAGALLDVTLTRPARSGTRDDRRDRGAS